MMNIASLELCKELYELSKWRSTNYVWRNNYALNGKDEDDKIEVLEREFTPSGSEICPAYDLGYLLRKLPHYLKNYQLLVAISYGVIGRPDDDQWQAGYYRPSRNVGKYITDANTPEDAACKLAIELLKQGILNHA